MFNMTVTSTTLILLSLSALSAESSKEEIKRFGAEAIRMTTAAGFGKDVAVTLLSPRIKGACMETPHRRLLVIDNGYEENIRSLKHEINHMQRYLKGDPNWNDDPPAIEAESKEVGPLKEETKPSR